MITFRDATEADIEPIRELVTSAYRGEASRAGWTTEADLLDGQRTDAEEIRALIADASGVVLLAESAAPEDAQRRLVACCRIGHNEGGAADEGYFGMFSVDPAAQAGGIGRQVLAEAERLLATRFGFRTVVMTVIEQRLELIAWYERRGYVNTGVHKPFPYGDERFGIPRRDDLRFVVLEKRLAG